MPRKPASRKIEELLHERAYTPMEASDEVDCSVEWAIEIFQRVFYKYTFTDNPEFRVKTPAKMGLEIGMNTPMQVIPNPNFDDDNEVFEF